MCEVQGLLCPLFTYLLYSVCENNGHTDECVRRLALISQICSGCRGDNLRLGLCLLVVSTVCEQKAGEYLIVDLWTRPVFS